jgi:hypothetical protein
MHSPRASSGSSSGNATEYRDIFVMQVHQLIHLGYQRLTPANYQKTQEPAITGDLVESIDAVLSDCTEDWMIYFSVHDDPPVNDGLRKGKKRKRVDLRIDSARTQPRARFRFEAKRLGKGHSVKVYLGPEGLGCFLRGDYGKEDHRAGMLGYVQSEQLGHWGRKIAKALADTPTDYEVDPSFPFGENPLLSHATSVTYQSRHNRPTVGHSIVIDHLLLLFQ